MLTCVVVVALVSNELEVIVATIVVAVCTKNVVVDGLYAVLTLEVVGAAIVELELCRPVIEVVDEVIVVVDVVATVPETDVVVGGEVELGGERVEKN